ncbi:hypothetical protein C8F04DRAFT_1256636 [Mycena alexandri]|uniref:Myb/SANT-like domain-containing protein n=1 Tax=Mycena alexandri TaxID=1745969 RepID=A0AAD6T2T1_9AGAR|nr:hypothetical protein C8F04DRAFT_1256636 [Mycena alexandri]
MPPKDAANWMANPEDLTNVLQFLHSQKSRAGQGGNFNKTVFTEAAAYMAKEFLPKAGGPKTANSIAEKWKAHNFVKAHPHFENFATRGWAHFQVVDKIVPSRARGRYVFNAGATQADGHGLGMSLGSPDDDNVTPPSDALIQSSNLSQPFSDWSQTNVDGSQTPDVPDPASSSQISMT